VVFDLDATLYDHRPRTLQILMEYAQSVRGRMPEVATKLATLDDTRLQPHLADTLQSCGVGHPAVVQEATAYWSERFDDEGYLDKDLAIEGGPEFVQDCYHLGACIAYLSGRDLASTLVATSRSLLQDGFPLGLPGVQLVLKASRDLPDDVFKREAMDALTRTGHVVGFFAADVGECAYAAGHHRDAQVGLVELYGHIAPQDPPPGVVGMSDFRRV